VRSMHSALRGRFFVLLNGHGGQVRELTNQRV
jgi:creatinine amidohydrolase/Fe(II)-dependent formamide hydrolase-like protein